MQRRAKGAKSQFCFLPVPRARAPARACDDDLSVTRTRHTPTILTRRLVSDIMAPQQQQRANSLTQLSWTKTTGQLSAEWSTNQVRAAALTAIPLQVESAGTEAAANPIKC